MHQTQIIVDSLDLLVFLQPGGASSRSLALLRSDASLAPRVARSVGQVVLRRRASRNVAIRIAILDYDKHQHMAVARLRKFSRGNASGYETQ